MANWNLITIVPAALRDAVNAKLLDITHGETFTAPLAPPGASEPTHYWASHAVNEEQYTRLAAVLSEYLPQMQWFWDTDPEQILSGLGLIRYSPVG